jgi:hypothetical protein
MGRVAQCRRDNLNCGAAVTRSSRVLSDGAGAIAHNRSAIHQCYGGGLAAYDGGRAFQCIIRNIEGENFFVGLGRTNVVSFREYQEDILPLVPPRLDELHHRLYSGSRLSERMWRSVAAFGHRKAGVLQY